MRPEAFVPAGPDRLFVVTIDRAAAVAPGGAAELRADAVIAWRIVRVGSSTQVNPVTAYGEPGLPYVLRTTGLDYRTHTGQPLGGEAAARQWLSQLDVTRVTTWEHFAYGVPGNQKRQEALDG